MDKNRWRGLLGMLLGLSMLLGLLPTAAWAETEEKKIKVGFFAMDGYHVVDENGVRSGYGYDFLNLVSKYSDLRFEYVGYDKSWDEMQQMLLDGEIDLLTSAQKTPERETLYDFTDDPIGTSAAILTVRAGDYRYDDGNYEGMRVGLVENSSRNVLLDGFMTQRGFSYTPVYFDDINELTQALAEGTLIDAAMSSNLRRTSSEWTLETLDSSPYYAIVRKGDAQLLRQLNAAIGRMDVGDTGWRTRLYNENYSSSAGDVLPLSSEEREYLAKLDASGRVLTVTMNPDCAPYSYFEDGEPRGIVPEIFAEVASRLGLNYQMKVPADMDEYRRLCTSGEVDIILDGLNDPYITEEAGLEISAVYYSTPLAVVTTKSNAPAIKTYAQPNSSVLNERLYAGIFEDAQNVDLRYSSYEESAQAVRKGRVGGSVMPYYCAQWLCGEDYTGRLNSLMLSTWEQEFVYAVGADEDYPLLTSLNRGVDSLSRDYIASLVNRCTQYPGNTVTFRSLVYQYPVPAACIVALLTAAVLVILYLMGRSRRAYAELARSRRLERYIGYLCDMYYRVLEVDYDLGTRRQYIKENGFVVISERRGFTGFDLGNIHPQDREATAAVFAPESVRALFSSGVDESYVESRMRDDSGDYRWYSFLLKLIPVDEKHTCSVMVLIKDMDELHRERQRNHDALLNALDTANTASKSKSAFLSNMSHEIRTPLNAVIGYMTIAENSMDNRDKVLHCIESAGISARHLLSIINDILDISSMESGKMKIAKERFDLKEQISVVSSSFYQQCKEKNIDFSVIVEGLTDEWVIGDSMRVRQILMNLMSNAVKFTSEGGVNLNITQTGVNGSQVFIRFTVSDTGIGMSPEFLERLYSPFEQESAATARSYGGTGLGMPITLNLVELMGGSINVESKQGEGTTFTVTLPFGCTENPETKNTFDFTHLHVLIVDDMENEREYIRDLLRRCGVTSQSARSGEEAVGLISKARDTAQRFDMCIIDWNMPGLNGVETTKLIRDHCDPNIPIIIATAYDITEFEREAISAGAVKIVSKPLFQSTVLDLLVSTYGVYEAAPEPEESIPDLNGMRVLLAEDNATNVEVAVDLLELAGVSADIARNGQEAVELFEASSGIYDAILMDVQMPVMDGYAATRAIRASSDPRGRTIPIIALTADALSENVAAAVSAGMDGHIAKPIETKLLFSTLQKYWKK